MIIGHGDIAGVLKDRDDRLYFASGVSNSGETRDLEYRREIDLLMNQSRYGQYCHLIYFSTLSVFYSRSRYVQHKRRMEELVGQYFSPYTIIRIGNIAWGKNPHTLINFIRERIRNRESFEIRDEYRYILEREEFLHWIGMVPPWSCEMNLTGRRMKVIDVVKEYCYPWRSDRMDVYDFLPGDGVEKRMLDNG